MQPVTHTNGQCLITQVEDKQGSKEQLPHVVVCPRRRQCNHRQGETKLLERFSPSCLLFVVQGSKSGESVTRARKDVCLGWHAASDGNDKIQQTRRLLKTTGIYAAFVNRCSRAIKNKRESRAEVFLDVDREIGFVRLSFS